ncbi:MAG: YggT family protein [Clostridia bacterium]|nr:YggT family protein [Clostridia bacterium]
MTVALYVIVQCVLIFIDVLSLAMLVRAILSWFTMGEQTKIGAFLYVVTEPVILPIRALCNRFGWFQGLPLDMPFFITVVLLSFAGFFLQAAIL